MENQKGGREGGRAGSKALTLETPSINVQKNYMQNITLHTFLCCCCFCALHVPAVTIKVITCCTFLSFFNRKTNPYFPTNQDSICISKSLTVCVCVCGFHSVCVWFLFSFIYLKASSWAVVCFHRTVSETLLCVLWHREPLGNRAFIFGPSLGSSWNANLPIVQQWKGNIIYRRVCAKPHRVPFIHRHTAWCRIACRFLLNVKYEVIIHLLSA